MPKKDLLLCSSRPNKSKAKVDLFCCIKAKVDDNLGERDSDTKCYECLQAPETASKPFCCNEVNLSNENQAELSRMSLENTTVEEKPTEPNSSTPHDGCRIAVGNSQTESSRRSLTDLRTARKRGKFPPGKPSQAQQHQICQRNKGYAKKSVRSTAAARWQVKPIQVEANVAQPVKQSAKHINPPSKVQLNKVAQPVKESAMHINPPSDGVRKSFEQNKVAQPVKESATHINPSSDGIRKSIQQNKVAQPVKESEIHINPPTNGVRKSIQQNKVSQPIKSSGANKTVRTVNPQKVWRVKEKNEATKSSPKPCSKPEAQRQKKKGFSKRSRKPSSKPASQRHHIKWHGFDESIGWSCCLCEDDLAHSPTEEEHETDKFPDVAVLSCGHAFHDVCLQLSTSNLQCSDPPCIICASFSS
ncbi:hypothetical protein HS088_TW04G01455 [Tripterygium wilfordii]|uniref:RING-type domain-containing protein n=1 Tax=Tripterygium wilfordii TaxID=458696 RepID=A0A7J7DTM5_TRIWF|nr:uncharacterized protein LOC119997210 [Tripterygium wilfordii]KAF5749486.1 hypothetical protein HS088_TW04G01455 [Tripterygium wilfordii]